VDAAEDGACPPGTFDPVYDMNREVIDDPSRGFPAYVTDTEEYGWLVTAGMPVFDKEGVVGYALADISMDEVKARQSTYAWSLSWALLGFTAVISLVTSLLVRRFVSGPLNTLSRAAARYRTANTDSGPRPSFEKLSIHTGDEIETLYHSMVTMEHDIDTYIENLLDTENRLAKTRQRAETMSDLARTDALTGARNRLAFDQASATLDMALARGSRAFGIAVCDLNDLKVLNDTYGHERGNEAIMRLVEILRETFVHSAVYRIGGDEFAIILVDADFAVADELVASFDDRIAELKVSTDGLEPWERVSAAIGYAAFDATSDVDATGVFARADHAMYLKKRAMKGADRVR
jgi:diguanylate cyclase (GGDEF)-like protein